jgi:hypothetical protein
MQKGNIYSRARKPVVEAVIAAFILATLSYALHGMAAQGCSLFENASWVALEVLRPVIRAAWESMSAYLCEDSVILQQVVQIAVSIGPLLCAMVGLV